jgi:hypothetical protein
MTTDTQKTSMWPLLLTGVASAAVMYKIKHGFAQPEIHFPGVSKDIIMATAWGVSAAAS